MRSTINPTTAEAVRRACHRLETETPAPDLQSLSADSPWSAHHFHRVFKAATGLTPKAYAQAIRDRRVRQALAGKESVLGAAFSAGFGASSRFYAHANQALGMAPGAFRKGGEGQRICFAVGQASLGAILVAQSQKGVCAIFLGEDPDALVRQLQDSFPKAELVGGQPGFERLVAKAVGLVESPALGVDLPLDIQGTAFQARVWEALRHIPAGQTVSYAELARRIGQPQASRAVARACAANRLAVAIPCHRVVRTDGSVSGYRWGVERKQALLDRERQANR